MTAIDLYLDTGDLVEMRHAKSDTPRVKGFTTNPTLARKAGVTNYEAWAREALVIADNLPVSLEVLSDNFDEMRRQGRKLAALGPYAYVKIPVTNSAGHPTYDVIRDLTSAGVKVNVTALTTTTQVYCVARILNPEVPAILSVFAGRIADTGIGPKPIMRNCKALIGAKPWQLLWASTREVYNIRQAEAAGCDIITVSPELLAKAALLWGYDPEMMSLDTVRQFARDAREAGFVL